MLEIEREREVTVDGRVVGTIYAVMADAATIRAWIANPRGASITMIPYDTREQAIDACKRLGQ